VLHNAGHEVHIHRLVMTAELSVTIQMRQSTPFS